ncbi:unnamed protein product, partial [marine sediment metagenome]
NSTARKSLEDEASKNSIKINFQEYTSYADIKAALDSNKIDCFSSDGAILNGYTDDSTKILSEKFAPQNYGIATKRGKVELASVVNSTIKEMKDSGKLNELTQKWGIK